MTGLRALCLSILLAPMAVAQEAGERLWAVDVENILTANGYTGVGQPRVGPDGIIYVGADSLYALHPDGRVKWTAPVWVGTIDLGADGTVYAASGHTVHAFHPDGAPKWSFTDPGGWGITTGPTVGPDGNVYAVTIQGGLGAFSLTPEGELRWNVPGFFTSDGVESARVAFGPDNMYYADGTLNVEGCPSPYDGLVSISLDGDLEWCHAISGVFDPPNGVVATLDGRGIVQQNALPGIDMQAYRPDGERDWVQTFRTDGIGVGPDNHLYMFVVTTLVSLTADGEPRWSMWQPINNFPQDPVVAPDLSAIISGSSYGFGNNGIIIAADPEDGQTLWDIPVTGPSAGAGGPAAFSPDGAVVYVPINTLSHEEPDQLWAIRVAADRSTGTGEPPAAPALALSAPAPSPTRGVSRLTLSLDEAQAVTVAVYDALGRRVVVLQDGTLAAGTHPLSVDAAALPAGIYVVRAETAGAAATQRLVVMR